MSLTRKHFENMADVMLCQRLSIEKKHDDGVYTDKEREVLVKEWIDTCRALAIMCAKENSMFNNTRFLQACGVTKTYVIA